MITVINFPGRRARHQVEVSNFDKSEREADGPPHQSLLQPRVQHDGSPQRHEEGGLHPDELASRCQHKHIFIHRSHHDLQQLAAGSFVSFAKLMFIFLNECKLIVLKLMTLFKTIFLSFKPISSIKMYFIYTIAKKLEFLKYLKFENIVKNYLGKHRI